MQFEVASGSVTGRDHVHALRNNQDAVAVAMGDCTALVVCDGSSSGRYSEVGAHIAATMLATEWALNCPVGFLRGLEIARQNVLGRMSDLAWAMGTSRSKVITEYFLFTIMAAIIGPEETLIVGIGDGVYALNGQVTKVGPFENNAPPYVAYELTGSTLTDQDPQLLKFQIHECISTAELQTLMVGTDGVSDLIVAQDRPLPGRPEVVGPVSQFWSEDRFFKNPFTLSRRLNMINPAQPRVRITDEGTLESHEGLLPDDTTLAVVRR